MSTHFLVGCPHSYCTDELLEEIAKEEGHMCDAITSDVCDALKNLLGARVFKAPHLRSEGDLNRDSTLWEPWRKAIEAATNEDTFYVDVHSFPSWDPQFGPYDFVLLTSEFCPMCFYNDVKTALASRGYRVAIWRGQSNSLINRACSELNAAGAVLIEINEKMMDASDMVASAIAGAVKEAASKRDAG